MKRAPFLSHTQRDTIAYRADLAAWRVCCEYRVALWRDDTGKRGYRVVRDLRETTPRSLVACGPFHTRLDRALRELGTWQAVAYASTHERMLAQLTSEPRADHLATA